MELKQNESKVKVLDAICGAGKTMWVFDHIKTNPDKRWLFVSPYLSEAGDGKTKGRIQNELPELNFRSPSVSPTKTESFKRLASAGHNIAITHSLFHSFSMEIAELLEQNEYHLVIDETIDLVSLYDDIEKQDVVCLIKANMIQKQPSGLLTWNHTEYPNYEGRDTPIRDMCDTQALWLHGENVLIQRVPPTIIKACSSCTILTYMFEGSLMKCWFDLNQISYSYFYPDSLRSESDIKSIIREKLHIVKPSKYIMDLQLDDRGLPRPNTFSMNWYKNTATEENFKRIKSSMVSQLQENMGKGKTFWTTFKKYKTKLEGKGYTRAVKGVEPFVPKNMRASNEYSEFVNCLYTVNVYPDTTLISHLSQFGVEVNREVYALSEMIQFLFRGCIRKHEEMYILILSNRMRMLLENYLLSEVVDCK